MERLVSRPFAPRDKNCAAIEVPQGFFGLANKPHKNVQFMTTSVAQCVALAFVGYNDDSTFPLVSLAHIDTPYLAEEAVHLLFAGVSEAARTEDISAYIVNGDHHPDVLDPICHFLERLPLEKCQTQVHDSQVASLTIDLRSGEAYAINQRHPLRTYVPDAAAENICMNYLFNRIAMPDNPFWADEPGYPMAMAFHLSGGVPDFYRMDPHTVPANIGDDNQPRA